MKRKSLFLLLGAGLAILGLVELALRVFTSPDSRHNLKLAAQHEFDPVARFRNKANFRLHDGATTNERGYLAPSGMTESVPEGILRFVYVGDSVTFRPAADNYPRQIETWLEQRCHVEIETLNAAVVGYSTRDALALFEHEVSLFDGDILFVYLGINDLRYGPEGLPFWRLEAGYPLNWFETATAKLFLFRPIYLLKRWWSEADPVVDQPLTERERALYASFQPTYFRSNLSRILEMAEGRYQKVFVLNIASLANDSVSADEIQRANVPTELGRNLRKVRELVRIHNRATAEVAGDAGAVLVDIAAAFESSPAARQGFLDTWHISSEGAGTIAAEILRRLDSVGSCSALPDG